MELVILTGIVWFILCLILEPPVAVALLVGLALGAIAVSLAD